MMSDTLEVLVARIETDLKHIVENQAKAELAAAKHRENADKILEGIDRRVENLEKQLVGGKAFAHGFRYAVYLMWTAFGIGLATLFDKVFK